MIKVIINKKKEQYFKRPNIENKKQIIPTWKIIKQERVVENTTTHLKLFKKFIGHLVKQGKRRRALRIVNSVFNILNTEFNIQYPINFLFIAIYRNKPIFELQKVKRRSREIIYPRILSINRRYTRSLFSIMHDGWENVSLYKNVETSIAYSIIEYGLGLRFHEIEEVNRIAYENKYNFLIKMKRNRSYRRIKKLRLNNRFIRVLKFN